MKHLAILFSFSVVLGSSAKELKLPELFKQSNLVCIGTVVSENRTGKITKRMFDSKDSEPLHLPMNLWFYGAVELEETLVKVKCRSFLKDKAPSTITIRMQYRPRGRPIVNRDVRDAVDYLRKGKTYLIYLNKVGALYESATFTKSAIELTAPVKSEDTVVKILQGHILRDNNFRRRCRLFLWLRECLSEEQFTQFLWEHRDTKDKLLREHVYSYLMRADRPRVMAEGFKLMLDLEQARVAGSSAPDLRDRSLTLCSGFCWAMQSAPSWDPKSLKMLQKILEWPTQSYGFNAALGLLEESSTKQWSKGKHRVTALNTALKICKPAVIECLRQRKDLTWRDQLRILVILSRMDQCNYLPNEDIAFKTDPKRYIRSVLKKYPLGWDKKK